ncbi:MAG: hypothetical protein MZV70_37360 [Desulfobacterales bacterium]|nr:hypothetical protein [Desulfobacterales bacterium]
MLAVQHLAGGAFRELSSDAATRTIGHAPAKAASASTSRSRRSAARALDAVITVTGSVRDEACRWTLRIDNRAGLAITSVQFPFLVVRYRLDGTPGTEALLRAWGPGALYRAPRPQHLPPDRPQAWEMVPENMDCTHYPGYTTAQLLAYGNDRAGFIAWCDDAAGRVKIIQPLRRSPAHDPGPARAPLRARRRSRGHPARVRARRRLAVPGHPDARVRGADRPVPGGLESRGRGLPRLEPRPAVGAHAAREAHRRAGLAARLAAARDRAPAGRAGFRSRRPRGRVPSLREVRTAARAGRRARRLAHRGRPDGVGARRAVGLPRLLPARRGIRLDGGALPGRARAGLARGHVRQRHPVGHRPLLERVRRAGSTSRRTTAWPASAGKPTGRRGKNGGARSWRPSYACCLGARATRDVAGNFVRTLVDTGLDWIQFLDQNIGCSHVPVLRRRPRAPPAPGHWMTDGMRGLLGDFATMGEAARREGRPLAFSAECPVNEVFLPHLQVCDVRVIPPRARDHVVRRGGDVGAALPLPVPRVHPAAGRVRQLHPSRTTSPSVRRTTSWWEKSRARCCRATARCSTGTPRTGRRGGR